MKKSKRMSGITLIALVITIIVLLILAGVTVATLTGDNGILTKAQIAKKNIEQEKELEKIKLAVNSSEILDDGKITTEKLRKELDNENLHGELRGDGDWVYKGDKSVYIITKKGEVYVRDNIIIYGNIEEKNILPEGYKKVEYLEGSGNQYINTQYYATDDTIMKFGFMQTTAGMGCIIGQEYDWAKGDIFRFFLYTNHHFYLNYGDKSKTIISKDNFNYDENYEVEIGNFYIKNLKNNEIIVEGNSKVHFDKKTWPCHIFNKNITGRIYYLNIYQGNKEINKFIPAIDRLGKPCMYDIISETSFYNEGTGIFKYGQEVNSIIKEGVGDKNNSEYVIPIVIKESNDKQQEVNIKINEPLRKLNSIADYINLKDKKVVRYIKQDSITGELALLDKPIEEKIEINDIDFSNIISIVVKTEVKPSNIK